MLVGGLCCVVECVATPSVSFLPLNLQPLRVRTSVVPERTSFRSVDEQHAQRAESTRGVRQGPEAQSWADAAREDEQRR